MTDDDRLTESQRAADIAADLLVDFLQDLVARGLPVGPALIGCHAELLIQGARLFGPEAMADCAARGAAKLRMHPNLTAALTMDERATHTGGRA